MRLVWLSVSHQVQDIDRHLQTGYREPPAQQPYLLIRSSQRRGDPDKAYARSQLCLCTGRTCDGTVKGSLRGGRSDHALPPFHTTQLRTFHDNDDKASRYIRGKSTSSCERVLLKESELDVRMSLDRCVLSKPLPAGDSPAATISTYKKIIPIRRQEMRPSGERSVPRLSMTGASGQLA